MRDTALLILLLIFTSAVAHSGEIGVTISVDRSKPIWKVSVKNHGPTPLIFETLDDHPRNFGIEHWFLEKGSRLYIKDMAGHLYFHAFAPVFEEVAVGETRVFNLNPRTMSAEEEKYLELWKRRFEVNGSYEMRVFFGKYASPLVNTILKKLGEQGGADPMRIDN